jgi:hypothetical protein
VARFDRLGDSNSDGRVVDPSISVEVQATVTNRRIATPIGVLHDTRVAVRTSVRCRCE